MYGQYPIFHHRNLNHKQPVFFVRAQNGGEQGGKKSKCRKPDKRKQDGPIHKSFSYAPSCHGKGSAFILYCLCRLFYISHKKPALSPGFHQSLSADLLLRNHRLGICRPLREGKREGCLSSDPPYDHSGHGVQICS